VLWGTLRAPGRTPFIAVITPANLGLDRTNDSLGEALADGITSALVDSAEWKVVGRAPALDQTGHDQMLAWVQKNLHADLVLTGNYRVGENSEVRISLQLVRVDDGSLMWTHTDHRRLAYLAESQKELARAIVAEITEKAQHAGKRRPATPANEPARRFYARARDLWSTHSDPGLIQSMALFREASQADPGFAPAWAGLADANVELVQRSREPLEPRTANARAAALRALALDDRNAEAHLVLGWILSYKDWNFQEGAQHLQWAVTLDPIRVFPNIYYSQVLTILGDFAEAQAAVEAARARLPPIPEVLFQQGSVFFLARQYAKLEALGRELVALEPNAALGHWLIGLSLEQRGRVSQAIDEFQSGLQESPRDLRTLCALSHAYGLAGAKAKAMETMRLFLDPDRKELTQYTLSYCAALTYASVGRKDEAFEWLEKARAGHDASFPFLPYDPRFDPLKNDTRFKPLADSIRNRGNL
jgi:adenylate cyclase